MGLSGRIISEHRSDARMAGATAVPWSCAAVEPDQVNPHGARAGYVCQRTPGMICCLFVAAVLSPLGLWALPRPAGNGADCCATRPLLRVMAVAGVLAAAACLAAFLLQPVPFQHICRFLAPA